MTREELEERVVGLEKMLKTTIEERNESNNLRRILMVENEELTALCVKKDRVLEIIKSIIDLT